MGKINLFLVVFLSSKLSKLFNILKSCIQFIICFDSKILISLFTINIQELDCAVYTFQAMYKNFSLADFACRLDTLITISLH